VLAKFFIDRPIFAAVIAIVITLTGAISAFTLPISQYPPIAPPIVQVDCHYPGASAQVVAETIAAPIEQRINGVERMMYMQSQSTSDGSYTLTATFETGTDLNMAQILMQNRINLAMQELPDVVRATGVTTRKRSPELTLTISLNCPDGRYDQLYMSNYAVGRLRDELLRVDGVSDVTIFGQRDYSMRIWVDPDKLAARDLTALDVVNAVSKQNAQVALGQVGPGPGDDRRATQYPITMVGRLTEEKDFGDIVLKTGADGRLIRVRDVAEVRLGPKASDTSNAFDRKPQIGLAIFLLPEANALALGDAVKAKMEELAKDFPEGVSYEIGYDTTPFIRESIKEVFKSLRDSIILVAIVVLIFLQSWRAAIIPLAAVPVAIIGTFGAMSAVGFWVNNLTLFGLVLAVGIVVDDAIVVVEAVQHQLEKGLAPRAATLRAMEDVSGPIIAVGVVLVAVFLPCAFFPGIVGQFFEQFALTIAISTVISTVNSLTLSPALAAILLRPRQARGDIPSRLLNLLLGWFFRIFNWGFERTGRGYILAISRLIRVPALVLAVYGGLMAFTVWGYLQLPIGFIPQQDKGYMLASIQLPDAASLERTEEVIDKVAKICLETPGVHHVSEVAGNSFVLRAYGSNFGSMFIILDDFTDRRSPDLSANAILAKLRKRIAQEVPEGQVNVFGASAVPRLGRAGGVKMMVEDRGDLGPRFLQGQVENLIEKGKQQPGIADLFSVFRTNSPQLYVKVDQAACSAQEIDVRDVYATMQATLGARYVNDFNRFGRTWQVNVQATQGFRNTADDIRRLKVRSKSGKLVPFGAIAEVKDVTGPLVLTRYNMYAAAAINGNATPGTSSGDALAILGQLANQELPDKMAYEWTELAYIEMRSRDTGMLVFLVSVAVVFLVLAALYESWTLPLAVMLVVPVCVSCSLAGIWLTNQDVSGSVVRLLQWLGVSRPDVLDFPAKITGYIGISKQDVNIFTQVGFVVLIGLACKNAILIVEYAKRQRDAGADRRAAVMAACRLRFRPILMTSVAFVLGVTPLDYAHGAGAEMRTALGIAVFSGMLGVTFFGIFMTPAFFVLVDWAKGGRLFRLPWVRRTADALRWALALGFVRPLTRRLMSLTNRG
jgi:multidrug efflux pump